jgi:hypothetical protein
MNNFNIIKYADDIYGFENFLTKDECESILSILKEEEDLGLHRWTPISFYESFTIGYPSEGHELFAKYNLPGDFFKQLQEGFKERVAFVSGVDIDKVSNIGLHLQRWDKGAYAHYHSDNSDNDGNLGAFERSRYAAFLYLNDDFQGGTLEFKDKDLVINPKAGLLMVFHGGHKNMHKVHTITKGSRYTIGSFWDDKQYEDYSEEKRTFWEAQIKKDRDAQKIEISEWEEVRKQGKRLTPTGELYDFIED